MFKRMVDGVISAIKLVVNGRTQTSMGQTQQEQPGANSTSVQTATTPHRSADAQVVVPQKRRRGRPAAQPITVEQLQKQTQNPVLAVLGQGGLQREIRASKTNLPVKPVVKAKAARVPSIKAALLSQLEQAVAQTPMDLQSGEVGKRKTAASKTRQAVPKASTTKPKAAGSTTAVKKRTKKQTPAQTLTGRKSKARGS